MDDATTPVTCPTCGQSVHWLPDLNRTVALVGVHGPDDFTDCPGSLARVARPIAPAHTDEPQWESGGPGKSAYTDYRWQCGCGHRYDDARNGEVNAQHAAHLAALRP